VPTA
jgi:hypothetical protein